MVFTMFLMSINALYHFPISRVLKDQSTFLKASRHYTDSFKRKLTKIMDTSSDDEKRLRYNLIKQTEIREYKKTIRAAQTELMLLYLEASSEENRLKKAIDDFKNRYRKNLEKQASHRKLKSYKGSYIDQQVKATMGETAGTVPFNGCRGEWVQLPSKHDGVGGADAIHCQFNSSGNPTRIVWVESKYSKNGKPKLDPTKTGKQMTEGWMISSINKMLGSTNANVQKTGKLLKSHYDLIERRINVLDDNGKNVWYQLIDGKLIKDSIQDSWFVRNDSHSIKNLGKTK